MKQALGTLALMSLFAFIGLTGPVVEVQAATDVNVVYGSSWTSRVLVSTTTASRIDNWIDGKSSSITVISNRIGIQFQNLDSADNIWCSNSPSVSADVSNVNVGFRYASYVFGSEGLTSKLQYWCVCDDAAGAAGCVMSVRQIGAR